MSCSLCGANDGQLCCRVIRHHVVVALQTTQASPRRGTSLDSYAVAVLDTVAELVSEFLCFDARTSKGSGWAAVQAAARILSAAADDLPLLPPTDT